MGNRFPRAVWGTIHAQFIAGVVDLTADITVDTVLVFVFHELRFVLANIVGRGWSIPGGRIEAGESPEAAVRREANEESGAQLGVLQAIGYYMLTDKSKKDESTRCVPVYIARAEALNQLPAGYESLAVKHVPLDQMRGIYYIWDPLIEAVCTYAHSRALLLGWTS